MGPCLMHSPKSDHRLIILLRKRVSKLEEFLIETLADRGYAWS
jgi:hypothetical protein